MSEPIGETFVTITPLVNEQQFKAQAEPQIKAATQSIKAEVGLDVASLRTQLQEAVGGFRQAGKTGDEGLFGAIQQRTQSLKADIEALGEGAVQALAGDFAEVTAAETAAQTEMTRFVASVEQAKLETIELAAIEKERAAAQSAAVRARIRGDQQSLTVERERAALQAQTARGQLRNVLSGRADLGSLLSPRALVGFGVAGLAIGAVFQGIQDLQEALKVTGDEAFTVEGRFRNLGASLLSGDVVGAFKAITVDGDTVVETLEKVKDAAGTSSVDLRNLGAEGDKTAEELSDFASVLERIGGNDEFARAIREAAQDTQDAAQDARDLAAAWDASAQAVLDVSAAIASAGSEAAAFGERTRGVAPGRPAQPDNVDDTNTTSTQQAIAAARAARTQSLKDDLQNAKDEEADARAKIENQKQIVEGRAERLLRLENAKTEVDKVEKAIAAEAKRAAAERERDAKARSAEAKRLADLRGQQLRDALDFREQGLQLALQEAQATELTIADDRKALLALIRFNHAKSENLNLEKKERLAALAEEKRFRTDLSNLNKDALADALGVRRQNLENAILAAKLTDDNGVDDEKADAAKLKFLQNQVKRAKGDALAVAEARKELLQFRLSLKDQASGGEAFTLQDLFEEAAKERSEFGSNIASSSGGVLSGQDARGAFAGIVGQRQGANVGLQQLTEAEKQTAILASIDAKLTPQEHGRGGAPTQGNRGSLAAIDGATRQARHG
jgi:hypothetical protein